MSENIFAELYNRILGLFGQSTQREESKNEAVNRLRLVLMQDRTNLTPELLQRMRKELIELLSKYVELDKEALELNFEQEGEQMALMLSIPVVRAKDESEIEEALKDSESSDDNENDDEEENKEDDIEETSEKDDSELETEEEENEDSQEQENIQEESEVAEETEQTSESIVDKETESQSEVEKPASKKAKKSEE